MCRARQFWRVGAPPGRWSAKVAFRTLNQLAGRVALNKVHRFGSSDGVAQRNGGPITIGTQEIDKTERISPSRPMNSPVDCSSTASNDLNSMIFSDQLLCLGSEIDRQSGNVTDEERAVLQLRHSMCPELSNIEYEVQQQPQSFGIARPEERTTTDLDEQ